MQREGEPEHERGWRWGRPLLMSLCGLGVALAVARLLGLRVPAALLVLVGLAIVGTVGAGVALLPSGIFVRPLLAASFAGARGRFAITFDDGPHPVHTRRVLDLLEARGHRATFFVIGAHAEKNLALVTEIARRGHAVANHSYAHARTGPLLSAATLAADLARATEVIRKATGSASRWFRPPIGIVSPPVVEAARRAGLEIVGWSASGRDGTAGATVESALARLRAGLRPGAILVLHDAAERADREPIAAAVLPALLDEAEARGLRSVTLDELFAT